MEAHSRRRLRFLFWAAGLALLFALYTSGLKRNPPGFYLDESAHAYNSYMVAHTGAGEIGPRFPLFFQIYPTGSPQYADGIPIYLLAAVFRFLPPSILLARIVSAFWIFAACLLLGLLARRISGRRGIGVIIAGTALLTPWFFEARGLVLEQQFVPLALALFLLAVYHAQKKERWEWRDVAMLAATLAAVTYCFTTGCILGPLLALGLLFFATTRQRLFGVIKTGLLYGLMLLPILLFDRSHPGLLVKRFNEASYIKPGLPWSEVPARFVKRYLEDQNLAGLLVSGDVYPRHHVQGSGGVLFFATLILVLIGLVVVLARRRRDPWWRFVLYGVVVGIVPGAISNWPFHQMRLIAYPVFLLLLIVPALEWLLDRDKDRVGLAPSPSVESGDRLREDGQPLESGVAETGFPRAARVLLLCALLALMAVEAYRFQIAFRRDGRKRSIDFDAAYKEAYVAATRQPARPIYLEDGKSGPAYIHALWYAIVEKRPTSQFVRLTPGVKPPPGKIVISSAESCQACQTLARSGVYHVYKSL
jgi:4-amino-4-deoxy-L-arabinose transferase-like glycosyltransferase